MRWGSWAGLCVVAIVESIVTRGALADDWDHIRIGQPTILGFYNICPTLSDARILKKSSIYNAQHPEKIDQISDLSVPQCLPADAEITPVIEVVELGRGLGWNSVFEPAGSHTCEPFVRVAGGVRAQVMPCDWEIQPSRFFWVRYVTHDGRRGEGITEIFPSSITVQYLEHLRQTGSQ